MAPSEFYLRLQKGITGGFAPTAPTAVHSITKPGSQAQLLIQSSTATSGTSPLSDQDAAPKALSFDSSSDSDAETHALVEELHGILKKIPTESPPGSEDIYGQDISIAWGSEDLQWVNRGPSGCATVPSEVQPKEEDRRKFKRAVEIVNTLVGKVQ